jgi:hypothetical protein
MVFFHLLKIASNLQNKFLPLLREVEMSRYSEIKKATAEVVNVRVVRKSNIVKAHAAIRDVILASPTLSYAKIAALLGCSRWLVYRVAVEFGVRRARGAGSPARRKEGQ